MDINHGIRTSAMTVDDRGEILLAKSAFFCVTRSFCGAQLSARSRQESPSTQVLMASQFDSDAFTREALTVGAGGYILKSNASKQLIPALREICAAE
jgi:DNA-binding NarL/FixJ family response regulator